MTRSCAAIALVVAFAAGVVARDITQDWADAAKKAELGRRAYACSGYLVADKRGEHECRALMPRLDGVWPIPGDPVRLKKREIKTAIGGPDHAE